jgi:hypothetical protein
MSEQEIVPGDSQLLQEIVTNERIIDHPKLGKIRLVTPTLDLQRKIDTATRKRKKYLRMAVDEVLDDNDPSKVTRVPAYKSREALEREYRELGWWTEEQNEELKDLAASVLQRLTELELLGFESEELIYDTTSDIQEELESLFTEHEEFQEKIWPALQSIVVLGSDYYESEKLLRKEATSTEVDDLLDELVNQHRIYTTFVELLELQTKLLRLQSEYSSLFSDSWQEQLQYFARLAQVFYCTCNHDTGDPLWSSIEAIEQEHDIETVQFVFKELDAFWKGFTDDVRDKMEKYSFMYGQSVMTKDSEDSPEPQESNEDGDTVEKTPSTSTEVTATQEP